MQLSAAYAVCASIARREARNFYFGFLALPAAKRRAFFAVYSFMRRADDICDDSAASPEQRKRTLDAWLERWRRALAGEATDDPVFLALRDAVRRFDIPAARLDELVHGVSMDLDASLGGGAQAVVAYRTFEELYRYCYYVASVVGLVCIRIFGYSDARAEKLAERTGIAFQLTNIIRDVKEDARMGRVYIPAEDLKRFGFNAEGFWVNEAGEMTSVGGQPLDLARLKELLRFEAERAREYYESARELLPYISADSRPSLRVLVGIYSRLLDRIAERNYDVLTERVRLSGWEKTSILAKGLLGFSRA
ncbi:MAG: phytoene/squalene synthase family protein [Acidobacteriaceae bacterium]